MNTTWKYQALSRTGHETAGRLVGNKPAVLKQLADEGMYVIGIQREYWAWFKNFNPRRKLSAAELSRLFEDMQNMTTAGLGLPQMLIALQETANHKVLLNLFADLEEQVRRGDSFAQALARSGAFPWIAAATIGAGENSGGLQPAFLTLSEYFRRRAEICGKLAEALVYPSIFFAVLMAVMLFIGLRVVPHLQELLPAQAATQPLTQALLVLSAAVQKLWVFILFLPVMIFWGIVVFRQKHRASFERCLYGLPIIGRIVKESDMAQYFLNLSVLLKSGVALLRAVEDLNALDPSEVSRRIFNCREYLFSGMSFWESVKMEGFFPAAAVFTLRRGEELARLDSYCATLSEYYSKQVNMRVDRLLVLVQPLLLLAGGGFLAVVAFAFLVPIYGSLSKIAGG